MSDQEMNSCPSALVFDRVRRGESSVGEDWRIRQHLRSCAACTDYWHELTRVRQEVQHQALPQWLSKRRRAWPRLAFGPLLLATAMLALVWLPVASPDPEALGDSPEEAAPLRIKGLQFGAYLARAGDVRRLSEGEALTEGDALRFFYASEVPMYLAVIDLDGRGEATVFYPDELRARLVPAHHHAVLDVAIELDDSPGGERIFGVFCDEPILIADLRERLQHGGALPSGCHLQVIEFDKFATRGPAR